MDTTFVKYCAVYRNLFELNENKWDIMEAHASFEKVHEDVVTIYQFKGYLIDWGWFIYGIKSDGTKIKLDYDGKPVEDHDLSVLRKQ